ncbi:MAG: hypothetical protein WCK03_01935 [Candidatus Taylorbacteria bacterium]
MKKPKNKEITISDIIPDMKRDIREIQKEQSDIRFYDRLLDENIDKLSNLIGRKLTKEEKRKVFGIVERYSPKLQDGDIIDYFPFDLAWNIYKIIKKNNFDEGCLKSRYLDEDIFEIAKEHDLSLAETEELQRFSEDNDFKDADKAYESWSSDR